MKTAQWGVVLMGLVLVSLSVWQIQTAEEGVEVVNLRSAQPPLTVFQARGANPLERPTVLIGHGFAGSGVIMRGYALTLAQAGFNAVTWDFNGHGSNPNSLESTPQRESLVLNVEQVLDKIAQKRLAGAERVAILGHSMGSGVALDYGRLHSSTFATIAVSPVLREVTPELPHNLLLMAGTNEANFLDNAEQLMVQAGGEGGDHWQGTARALVAIPGANHLSILFDTKSHETARDWLEAVFGTQVGGIAYRDRRIAWFAVGVLGTLVAAFALAKLVSLAPEAMAFPLPLWRCLLALLVGILGASFSLGGLSQIGLDLSTLFGVLIGGFLMVWFAMAGSLAMFVLGEWPGMPSLHAVLAGLLTFAALWLGVGLLGDKVWQPWLLVRPRLVLWPLAALFLLPWFLAVGELARNAGWLGQGGVWLVHSALLLGGLFLAMRITPGIGFLVLIAPVFPAFFALHAIASAPYRGGWPFALSGALFTSWMLLAVFPLG